MKSLTLRGRVVLASIAVLAVALAGVSLTFNVLLDRQLADDAATVLRDRAAAQRATIEIRGGHLRIEARRGDAVLDQLSWVYEGRRLLVQPLTAPAAVRETAAALAGTSRARRRTVDKTVELLAVPVRDAAGRPRGTVIAGVSLVPYRHTRRLAMIGSIVLCALVLLIALVAVRAAVRSALRPIADMTRRAADWSEGDLHRRFALGPPRDELTALAATFDELLRRIEAVLRREQRFSAEMAHEMRTPLTGLRGEAELALARGVDDSESRAAFERVLEATQRMETVIETLLSSARAAEGPPLGRCDPEPPVREVIAAVAGAAASGAVDLRLAPPPEPLTVDTTPEIVSRALFPLLENGVRHAASRVDLTLARRNGTVVVAVADDGPGLPDDDVFEPGISTTGGAGLGLPLARRLARSCGGDVVAVPGAGGARFELTLPGG